MDIGELRGLKKRMFSYEKISSFGFLLTGEKEGITI